VIAGIGFAFVATWFVTQQESRFLIHVYVLMAILSVIGWRSVLSQRNFRPHLLAGTLVAISVFYGLFMIEKANLRNVHTVISPTFAETERSRNIPFRESFEYLNSSADVRRVLILDRSVPPFYCDKDYVKPVGQWGERMLPGVLTPIQALQRVGELNVSHVLDVNSEVAGFQIVGTNPMLTLVFESKKERIYKVN